MNILPIMLGVSLVLGLIGLVAFLWGVKHGHFDDPEGMRYRMLLDDEEEDRYQEQIKQAKPHEE